MPYVSRYVPAETKKDLPKGSPYKAMDAFLMSDRVRDVAHAAAKDLADDAATIVSAEATETGALARGYEAREDLPVVIDGHPRRVAVVVNNDPAAAPVEFGNGRARAVHPLQRAGEPYHTPKGTLR